MPHCTNATDIGPYIQMYQIQNLLGFGLFTWESNLSMLAKHAQFTHPLLFNNEI